MFCRTIPHQSGDGPGQMALDEFLLSQAALETATPALRTYEWHLPTLSLGYFQGSRQVLDDPRWRDFEFPLVRRATGGGAIWHDREITYALALPRSHSLARHATDLYKAVHSAIAEELRTLGLPAERRGEATARQTPERPFLCFLDRDAEDIVVGTHKILGSAQRRRAGALLQHGSLLLKRSARTPELPGIADLGEGLADIPADWSSRLTKAIAQALSLDLQTLDIGPEERLQVEQLAANIYRNPDWTHRRS